MDLRREDNEIIFLFSSWQMLLYKDGTYEALAYPEGYVMHFRYSKEIVDENIWNKTSRKLEGKKALIIAVSIEENGSLEFLPIRISRIVKVENDGDMLHIYIILAEWVLYNNSSSEYDHLIKKFDNIPQKKKLRVI